LKPVVDEIGYKRGWIVPNSQGKPFTPDYLSSLSSKYLHELDIPTTLHSMRHLFATDTVRITHGPLPPGALGSG
jgi:hypothetical protein